MICPNCGRQALSVPSAHTLWGGSTACRDSHVPLPAVVRLLELAGLPTLAAHVRTCGMPRNEDGWQEIAGLLPYRYEPGPGQVCR